MSGNRKLTQLAILFAIFFPTIITWLYFVALRSAPAAVQQAAYSTGKVIQFVFPVAWVFTMNRFEGRWGRPTSRGIWIGLGFGLLIGLTMWFLYRFGLRPAGFFSGPEQHIRSKVTGMGIDSAWKYVGLGVFYSVGHSFLEEYYWRWFVFRELQALCSWSTAILISSVGFMLHHILVLATFFGWDSPATWLFSLSVAVGGAVWAWLYERSQSLIGPWISHCLVDAAIFLIGYDLVREVFP